MRTLIIHPSDSTTDFLKEIYKDIPDKTVISYNCPKESLFEDIEEYDRIIMLGHGDEGGLYGFSRYMIDSDFVSLLKTKKNSVFIWCNADVFVNKHKLSGFYSGMIISDYYEALMFCVQGNYEEIEESNILFASSVKESIISENILAKAQELYRHDTNPIVDFNKNNLYYV